AALVHMPHLTKLYARDTLITDEGLRQLQDLHELVELDLYGTRIGDAGIAYLKGVSGMTKPNLLGAALTDQGLEQLAGLSRLEELNLYRTKITNASIEILKRFKNLREVDLRYTRVTSGGVAALKAALPGCRVVFLDAGSAEPASVSKAIPAGSADGIAAWVRQRGGQAKAAAGRVSEIVLASVQLSDAQARAI